MKLFGKVGSLCWGTKKQVRQKGDVAALIRSHVIGLQPFKKTIEQTTEQYPNPKNNTSCYTIVTITSLWELLHYCGWIVRSTFKYCRPRWTGCFYITFFLSSVARVMTPDMIRLLSLFPSLLSEAQDIYSLFPLVSIVYFSFKTNPTWIFKYNFLTT